MAYCLDEVVFMWGEYIEAEIASAEREARKSFGTQKVNDDVVLARVEARMRELMLPGKEVENDSDQPASSNDEPVSPTRGRFQDPAIRFGK